MTQTDFEAFTIRYEGRADRIHTTIWLFEPFDPDDPPEQPQSVETTALWDTGATRSVIVHSNAKALGLEPTGQAKVNHADGQSLRNAYVTNIGLPNNVGFAGVKVTECPDIASDFGAIIGMDIIGLGDLSITNVDGYTVVSFRTPSIQAVDYVDEYNKVMFTDVTRNDPCPCGATNAMGEPLTYDQCHGAQ